MRNNVGLARPEKKRKNDPSGSGPRMGVVLECSQWTMMQWHIIKLEIILLFKKIMEEN